jgi:hypothetical protein
MVHCMQKCIDLNGDYVEKIGESLGFPKMYYSMPINMFFIVKNHWEPYFTDNPRISTTLCLSIGKCLIKHVDNFSLILQSCC